MTHLLVQVLLIVMVARVLGLAFARIGQPAVIGEMAAGILLGPSLLGWLAPGAFALVFPASSLAPLGLLSQIGVCVFMFTVGMDLDLRQVRARAPSALLISHVSIALPMLLGIGLALVLFRSSAAFALFLGISLSITAFPVLARILRERGLSHTPVGVTAITCAALGDVTAWALLAFVVALARATGMAEAALDALLVVAFVALMLLGVRRVLPRVVRPEPSGGTLAVIAGIAVAAAFTAEALGIHALFGAFLAGAVMPRLSGFRATLIRWIEPFTIVLLPLFFAFTGLRTQIGLLDDVAGWLTCLLIIAVATLGKLGGGAAAARLTGMRWREALQLGALLNTRGLMELVALNIGYDLGILPPRVFTMLVIMALATTLLAGPLLTLFGKAVAAAGPAAGGTLPASDPPGTAA